MGAWGTAIFSDDLASDIRHEYNVLISFGKENDEVEKILLAYYEDILGKDDPDESIFWFALALSEWKKGRLSERVKKKALDFLANGSDLERWRFSGNDKNYQKRAQALEEFRRTILSPMPENKKIRKPTIHHCPWKVGSLLAYRIVTNKKINTHPCFMKYALLRVIKINKHPVSKLVPTEYYNESMLVGLYGWIGDAIPNPQIVDDLEFIAIEDYVPKTMGTIDFSLLDQMPEESGNVIKQGLSSWCSRRIETCAQLDWLPVRDVIGDITYLGCDERYETSIPDFFNTSITSYSLTHFKAFDVTLAKRLESYIQ